MLHARLHTECRSFVGAYLITRVQPIRTDRHRHRNVRRRVRGRHRRAPRTGRGAAGLSSFAGAVDLVFIDSEKEQYEAFLDRAVDALRPGGVLVADNFTSHAEDLEDFRRAALAHPQLAGLVVPIGQGELVTVKTPPAP